MSRTSAGAAWALAGLRYVGVAWATLGFVHAESNTPTDAPRPSVEGAIGLVVRQAPAFPGSRDGGIQVTPAGFLRWGRITVTGAGGFTTRADQDVERGLTAEIAHRGRFGMRLGLRYDPGRAASDSPELAGMGDIRSTLRARLSARWDPLPGWRVTSGVNADALGRGSGILADVGVSRQWPLGVRDRVSLTATLSAADHRFNQTWHGVTPAQALVSGLPTYRASGGLRDLSLGATWRMELWTLGQPLGAFVGAGHPRLLGAAADSPLTRQASTSSMSGALVWRF